MKMQMIRQIQRIFLAVIAMVFFCLVLSFVINHKVQTQYQQYVAQSQQFEELLTAIDSATNSMDSICFDHNEGSLLQFCENTAKIDSITDIMYDTTQPANIRIYARIVKWMMLDQLEYITEMYEKGVQSEGDFSRYSAMKTKGKEISNIAQQLFIEYTTIREEEYKDLLRNSNLITTSLEVLQFSILCISLILGIWITKTCFSQLKLVSDAAVRLSRKEWDAPDLPPLKYAELDQMGKTFNRMKLEITRHISSLEEKAKIENQLNILLLQKETQQRMLKEARLLALQMQINPHFLFNTFSLISRLITAEEQKSAIRVINAISKILRYSLDNQSKMVPISEELNCLKEYILIQQIRFSDTVKFIMKIDCDVSCALMPAFILQPLVENAVIHGMREVTDGGSIYVHVGHEPGFYHFEIIDNGLGFVAAEQNSRKSSGIGLVNIRERLKLHYQREDLFVVESAPNKGTHVHIRIPETILGETQSND